MEDTKTYLLEVTADEVKVCALSVAAARGDLAEVGLIDEESHVARDVDPCPGTADRIHFTLEGEFPGMDDDDEDEQ